MAKTKAEKRAEMPKELYVELVSVADQRLEVVDRGRMLPGRVYGFYVLDARVMVDHVVREEPV